MTAMERMDAAYLNQLPQPDHKDLDTLLFQAFEGFDKKIIVLDDDPTGVQTVHGVSVYTDWTPASIRAGFQEPGNIFYILTNSRAMSGEQTRQVHTQIARTVSQLSNDLGRDFILISRSDSTLRGHYPLETQALRETVEHMTNKRYCGEVICPYFREGGRFTIDNIHYVREGAWLVPAGETEFAGDKTFGYHASHLGAWCQEKTSGAFRAEDMLYIGLDELRACDVTGIAQKLRGVQGFQKVILNAAEDCDLAVFVCAYLTVLKEGKEFLFRTAAALPKALGRISDKPLLSGSALLPRQGQSGGIVLVGSHVKKTTQQLEALHSIPDLQFIEFNQHRVLEQNGLEQEVKRVLTKAEAALAQGRSVVVHTRRARFDLPDGTEEAQLAVSVKISDAITSIIACLRVPPRFVVAKGGITSSDVGTKALHVKRAEVMGQIAPGVPVWMTGPESKFPGIPFIIFPGNVGEAETLRDIVSALM